MPLDPRLLLLRLDVVQLEGSLSGVADKADRLGEREAGRRLRVAASLATAARHVVGSGCTTPQEGAPCPE